MKLPYYLAVPLLAIYPKKQKALSQKTINIYTPMLLHNSQGTETA